MDAAEAQRLFKLGLFCKDVVYGRTSLFEIKEYDTNKVNYILSKFTSTVEASTQKLNEEFYFNLEENKTKIWDFIFLYKVIEDQMDLNTIQNLYKNINKSNLLTNSSEIDTSQLDEFKELQKSILIARRLRNCRSHQNNAIIELLNQNNRQSLHFKNSHKGSEINCNIPISYLEEFGNGIRALDEHSHLKDITNEITSNIFFKLGFELKEIPNFMYNIHPSKLKFLLELVNNDMDNLNKLPSFAFLFNSIKIIKYLWNLVGEDIDKFSKLSSGAFQSTDIKRIEYLLQLVNGDIDKFVQLPSKAFVAEMEKIKFLWEFVGNDICKFRTIPELIFSIPYEEIEFLCNLFKDNLDKFINLDEYVIENSLERKIHLLKKIGGDPEKFAKLPRNAFQGLGVRNEQNLSKEELYYLPQTYTDFFIDFLSEKVGRDPEKFAKLPFEAFRASNACIDFLSEKVGRDPEKFAKLPGQAFTSYFKKDSYERIINFLFDLVEGDIDKFVKLPKFHYKNTNFKKTKYLWNLVGKDIDKFSKLSSGAFQSTDIKRIEYLLQLVNGDIDKFIKLPNVAFQSTDIKRIEYLLQLVNGDIDKFIKLPNISLQPADIKNFEYLLQLVNGDIDRFSSVPYFAFKSFYCKSIKTLWEIADKKIENFVSFPDKVFEYDSIKIECLWEIADKKIENFVSFPRYITREDTYKLEYLYKIVNQDFNKFLKLPEEAFSSNFSWLHYLFNLSEKKVENFLKIPEAAFCSRTIHTKIECRKRIKLLLKKVNYDFDIFNTLPRELFECNEVLVDELLELHKNNLLCSTFGMGNEKVVAITIFMNSLFANYNKTDIDFEELNISIDKREISNLIPRLCDYIKKITEINNYIDNERINDVKKDEILDERLEELTKIEKEIQDKIIEQKKEYIDLIRNCAEHFDIYVDPKNSDNVIIKHAHDGVLKYEKTFNTKEFADFLFDVLLNKISKVSIKNEQEIDLLKQSRSVVDTQAQLINQNYIKSLKVKYKAKKEKELEF